MNFFCKREDFGNEVFYVFKEIENNWLVVVVWLEIFGLLRIIFVFFDELGKVIFFDLYYDLVECI